MKPFVYNPPSDPLIVLYADQDILIVDKPSGLLSVPGKAAEHGDCLETRVRAEFSDSLLVHRLDMDTSGVMVFARNKGAQRHLGLQFEKRIPEKKYIARVAGLIANNSGHIDLPLIGDWPNRPLQMVDHERGKSAQTDGTVIEREPDATRVELRPKTGRSHQLRVHMLAIGHAILGDTFYGTANEIAAADRLQLHASILRLRNPTGGEWHEFVAPTPF
jgi:tRNA pseudouridine32 synthase/23S rRNA pseudouridine746 synthase